MDLAEYDRRRRVLSEAQVWLEPQARTFVPMPELRPAPTDAGSRADVSLTPTADGGWVLEEWFHEFPGNLPSTRLRTTTKEAALEWLWFVRTRPYFTRFLVPSAEQQDRKLHQSRARLRKYTTQPQPEPDEPWEDTSTDADRLEKAGMALVESWTGSAIRIARNPHTPTHVLDSLADSPCDSVRWQVAGNPSTPATALGRLRQTDDLVTRWHLAARPETPTSDIVEWSVNDSALWRTVLDRADAPTHALAAILEASSGALRSSIAMHAGVGADLVSTLAKQPDVTLGITLLRSERCSPEDVEDVMSSALKWDAYQLMKHLAHKPLPLDPLLARRLAQSDAPQHRMLAASSATTLNDQDLDALSSDQAYGVRIALAAAAGTVERVMRRLANDPQTTVRQEVAKNGQAPADVIADLALSDDIVVRRVAVKNPALPISVLRSLTGDFIGEVANAAKNALHRREQQEARKAQA